MIAHVSKHRQFDPITGAWIEGKVKIAHDTGLRKLMRAARRGLVSEERLYYIGRAMRNAEGRASVYRNAHAT